MIYLIYLLIFLLGISVGSFLNVVITRIPATESIWGRSFCPFCKTKLKWSDLIPLFSFLYLRRKCRYCKKPISWQYPIVEIATGLLFLLIFNYQFSIFNLVIICFLIVIFVIDLKHSIIPDKIIYPAIGITFLYQLFKIFNFEFVSGFRFQISDLKDLMNPLSAAFLASAFFLLLVLVSRGKWMGLGDVKLSFLMGLVLGFPNVLVALFLAFVVGAIIGLGLIASGSKKLSSEIPFGPFLCTATFIALFWGQEIINCYLGLI